MKFETRELFRKFTDDVTFDKIVEADSVVDLLEKCNSDYSSLPAITDQNGTFTYKTLYDDVAKFRGVIKNSNVKPNSRVGILGLPNYHVVKAFLATVSYGCTAVVLPVQLDPNTIMGVSMMFKLDAIIYDEKLQDKISVVQNANKNVKLIDILTEGKTVVPCEKVSPSSPCVIMFTGGTTGKSKGALLSHRAVMQGVVNGCYGTKEVFNQKYMLALPLSHVFGLIRNLLTPLYTGGHIYICSDPKDLFGKMTMFNPNILVLVPALAEIALNLSKINPNIFGSSLKYIICGASAVPPYLINEYDKKGISLLAGYGLTESANLVSGNPNSKEKPNSVGIPYPHQEFKIVNDELWLKGPNMLDCYVGNDIDNRNAFEDGWFKTGDLVRLDDDGYLYIIGRNKDIIILSNGENISPEEVENHFNSLDIIQDSQVFEKTLDNGSSVLAIEVFPRACELNKLGDIDKNAYILEKLNEVNDTLPSYMKISKFIIRDKDFNRSPSMKIVRYKNEVK